MRSTVDVSEPGAATSPPADETADRWWRESPLDRRGWLTVGAAYVSLTAILTVVGLFIVWIWEDSTLGRLDADVNDWLAQRRTPTWTTLSDLASMLSDTATMVAASAVLLPVFLWAFRRWDDWVLVTGALVLEVTTFVSVSFLVGRERPPVEQLDGAPTDSFPSGHIAAAVAFYGALAVVACWHTRERSIRLAFIALAVAAPTLVIASRLYRGMHYPTDAIGGLVLGVSAVVAMRAAIERTTRPPRHTGGG